MVSPLHRSIGIGTIEPKVDPERARDRAMPRSRGLPGRPCPFQKKSGAAAAIPKRERRRERPRPRAASALGVLLRELLAQRRAREQLADSAAQPRQPQAIDVLEQRDQVLPGGPQLVA